MGKKRSNRDRAHLGVIRTISGMPFYCKECGAEFNTLKELNSHKCLK